ncbi:(d)CMP kinase [Rickettsiaceae bacterium]|nr:(d)CMP kinase [Rickettsiaceae bacterium]
MRLIDKANDLNAKFVVALDGPSAAGKGLIGRLVAEKFGLVYVQSSIVYRGLAYVCMMAGISADDEGGIIELSASSDVITEVEGVDLNIEAIGEFASKLSVIQEVRENLGVYLINLIRNTPRIIMEGRDIGTVVAPNADLKIFITANVEVRAKRRFKQLQDEGKDCILSDVLKLLKSRDDRDSTRAAAPLKAASDALLIDTSDLPPEEVLQKIVNFML